MADSLISRPQTSPEQAGKDASQGNSLSAKMAPEMSSGKGSESANHAAPTEHHGFHHMSPAARADMEQKMSQYGEERHTLGSYVTTHYGYTDRAPKFDKDHNLIDFKRGMNKEGRLYFYKETVRVPVTDEMAVYKDNAEKMGWKFEDKDIKQPEILSMQLLTDFEPESKSDGLKTFIGECLINKVNQSGKHEIGVVTPGMNMKFKDMEAIAILTERDCGIPCVTDNWGSRLHLRNYSADQAGMENHYDCVDNRLWLYLLSRGILTPEQLDLFGFSKGTWADTEFLFRHWALQQGGKIPKVHSVNLVEANQPAKRIRENLHKLASAAELITLWVSNPHKRRSDKALWGAKVVDYYDQLGTVGPEFLKGLPDKNVRVIERNRLNSAGFLKTDHEWPSRFMGYDFRHPDAKRGLGLKKVQDDPDVNYFRLEDDDGMPKACHYPKTRDCTDTEGTNEAGAGNQESKANLLFAPAQSEEPKAPSDPLMNDESETKWFQKWAPRNDKLDDVKSPDNKTVTPTEAKDDNLHGAGTSK